MALTHVLYVSYRREGLIGEINLKLFKGVGIQAPMMPDWTNPSFRQTHHSDKPVIQTNTSFRQTRLSLFYHHRFLSTSSGQNEDILLLCLVLLSSFICTGRLCSKFKCKLYSRMWYHCMHSPIQW